MDLSATTDREDQDALESAASTIKPNAEALGYGRRNPIPASKAENESKPKTTVHLDNQKQANIESVYLPKPEIA